MHEQAKGQKNPNQLYLIALLQQWRPPDRIMRT